MKTNKLNLRSYRMKEAFRKLALDSYAVSLTAVNNTQDASGILTEAIHLDDNNTKYYFSPTVKITELSRDIKFLGTYYIRFLLLNSENLEGDKKYTDFFKILCSLGNFEFFDDEIQNIVLFSNNSSTSFTRLRLHKWTKYTVEFELYSYPDKKLMYPL